MAKEKTAQNSGKRVMPKGIPFPKGVSGNPGGRPKAIAEVRDLAREYTTDAIYALYDIMTKGKSESAKVAASNVILERGWGKAPVKLDDDDRKILQSMLGIIEA